MNQCQSHRFYNVIMSNRRVKIIITYEHTMRHQSPCAIFRTDFTDLNLYCIKWALAVFVLVSFSGYVY